jgi:ribonuclease R
VREGDDAKSLNRAEKAKPATAAEELAALREADRSAKLAARAAKAGKVAGKGSKDGPVVSPGRAAGGAASRSRKPGPQRAAPRARTRR